LPKVTAPEALDECPLAQDCIDQYLWSLYERARKIDTIKVQERFNVTIKNKKGKERTVTKTRTKLVDEDFTWKDPDAADKRSMSMQEYVIGGMERSFKLKLYRLMRAADDAGLAPGITSASAMTTGSRSPAARRRHPTAHTMAAAGAAAMATDSPPMS
jgi:hypothetical protein